MSQQRLPLCSFSSPHLSSFVSYNDTHKLSAFCFLLPDLCFLLVACCLLLEVLWADIAEGASQASCKFIQVPIVGLIDSILRIMPSCHASSAVP